jgi:uncharacterized protein YbbC (DUF1343 family)
VLIQAPSALNMTEAKPTLSLADTCTVAIPDTLAAFVGVRNETEGDIVSGVVEASANDTAFAALTRPQPKLGSHPTGPTSSADWVRMLVTCAAVRFGFAEYIRAATPDTIGAEYDVPHPDTYPPPAAVV